MVVYLQELQAMKRKITIGMFARAFKETIKKFGEYKIPKLSASLAYYTVFSMAPLLVMIILLAGFFLGQEAATGQVYQQLKSFLGAETADQLQTMIQKASVAGKNSWAAIIGGFTLLLGATTVFGEIQDSINSIWGLKAKPKAGFWKLILTRILSFSVIASLGFLLLVSLAISAVIDAIGNRLMAYFPDVTVVLFYIINLLLSLLITGAIFAVIFKLLPDAIIPWKNVWAGAVITAILFLAGKLLISIYISKANVGGPFGAAGSLVILMVWIYYSAMILYFGAAFTIQFAAIRGDEIKPNSYAVRLKTIKKETDSERPEL